MGYENGSALQGGLGGKRRRLLCRLLGVFLVLASGCAAPGQEAKEPGPIVDVARVAERMWWREAEIVAALGLDEGVQGRMDRELAAFVATRGDARRARAEAESELPQLLRSQDSRALASALERIEEAAGKLGAAEVRFRAAALGHLSQEQRDLLAERWPHLVRAPWTRSGPRATSRPGTAGGARTPRRDQSGEG